MPSRRAHVAEILLVEDNPGDVELTRLALERARIRNHLSVVADGVEALEYLRKQGKHKKAPRPDLVLLDLNLPRLDGREVLARMRQDPKLTHLPVVVLTTSQAEEDVIRSYQLHANAYIEKPVTFEDFIKIISVVGDFWLQIVTLPPTIGVSRPG